MKTRSRVNSISGCGCCLVAAVVIMGSGCSKSAKDSPSAAPIAKPAEAASQLQQAFVSAPVEVKQTATVASEAMRTADYETAMRSLQAMQARQDLTPQQSMAIHESSAALEARLIMAMERGDPNAKRAYEQLRKSRRQ